jgi:hypothetical protein
MIVDIRTLFIVDALVSLTLAVLMALSGADIDACRASATGRSGPRCSA